MPLWFQRCLCAATLVLALGSVVWAQTGLATATGIVTDNSGAAIPGVTVTATNQATNVPYTGQTTEAGVYVITGLPVGQYTVKVELQGFKAAESQVTLSASQTARIDFDLEVGTVQESLTVAATTAVLQSENAVVGTTLDAKATESLPTSAHNPIVASLFAPGSTTPNPNAFANLKNTTSGRPFVNGQREQGNNFTFDGVDMNDAIDNLVAYQPALMRSNRLPSRRTTTRPSWGTSPAPS
jgi:Carboxypeptidase regulatory-like domain